MTTDPLEKNRNNEVQQFIDSDINWGTDDFMYSVNVLLSEKSKDKNILKAIEELGELFVKLTQYLNKPEAISVGDIEEEIVDCEMHLHILKKYFPVPESLREKKMQKFLQSKEYKMLKIQYESNNSI